MDGKVKGMTACRVPEGDTISRQAAIDAFWKFDVEIRPSVIDAILNMLKGLPSAQPEIIMCKDCEHYKKEHGWNCIDYMVCAISPIHTVIRKPDDYCSRAERRTGEPD